MPVYILISRHFVPCSRCTLDRLTKGIVRTFVRIGTGGDGAASPGPVGRVMPVYILISFFVFLGIPVEGPCSLKGKGSEVDYHFLVA